jgi:hypothetical protein
LQQIQNFFKIPLSEKLYAVVDAEYNEKNPSFFLASHAPKIELLPWG